MAACCAAAGLFAQQFVSWDEAYRQADSLIARLSLDEKIYFARGYSSFFFYGVPEKGIPYLYLLEVKYAKASDPADKEQELMTEARTQLLQYAADPIVTQSIGTAKLRLITVVFRTWEVIAMEEVEEIE